MYKIIQFCTTLMLIFTLTACSVTNQTTGTGAVEVQNPQLLTGDASGNKSDPDSGETPSGSGAETAEETLAQYSWVIEAAEETNWDASAVIAIELNENSIVVDGEGANVEGSRATITTAGTYSLTGKLNDGQIVVDTDDEEVVRLILNGVDLRSSTSAPIYIVKAEKVVIYLADGTRNVVSDGEAYILEDAQADEPAAAIYSKADLIIYGNGSLVVNGNYNDGIASKDGLLITSGVITVNAIDDGIRGKDYLVIKDGAITIEAQGDGLKADNTEDAGMGFISINQFNWKSSCSPNNPECF